jgi:hypothetical protein
LDDAIGSGSYLGTPNVLANAAARAALGDAVEKVRGILLERNYRIVRVDF